MKQYFVGLDLGQRNDFSALAVIEKHVFTDWNQHGGPVVKRLAVRHLHRWPVGTSYVDIVRDTCAILKKEPLPGCTLVPDQSGVGRAIVDMLRQAHLPCSLRPVTIVSGTTVTANGDMTLHVPKRELAGILVVMLESRQLEFVEGLPHTQTLVKELGTFTAKYTRAGNEQFESARDRDHDDLVLAVALGAYMAERSPVCTSVPFSVGGLQCISNPWASGSWRG